MKKFTSLLISCSLALAGVALAQEPDEKGSPGKKKGGGKAAEAKQSAKAEKAGADAAKPGAKAKAETPAGKQQRAATAPATSTAPAESKTRAKATDQSAATAETSPATEQTQQDRKAKKRDAKAAKTAASPAAAPDATAAAASTTTTDTADRPGKQQRAAGAKKKPDQQKVQQIKTRHANFRAQPRPQQVPAVTFQQNYRIQGADRWQGPQYEVYRSYRPERHDRAWYDSRYQRVELIGGGYYYWNNGYWYPAWGYSPQAEYYAYDAPIYVGKSAEPPDRVIANVQATLQEMGYYKGEVDGLLGPLTREALTAYQADQGLTRTAVIDQPTLESLGMS